MRGITTDRRHEPREGWRYPVIDRVQIFDCRRALGMTVLQADGSIVAVSVNIDEILDIAPA